MTAEPARSHQELGHTPAALVAASIAMLLLLWMGLLLRMRMPLLLRMPLRMPLPLPQPLPFLLP